MPETAHRNFRLPEKTTKQLKDLSAELGLNGTKVVTLAIAKLHRSEILGVGKRVKKSEKPT